MIKYAIAAGLLALSVPAFAADDAVTYRVEVHGGYDRVAVGGFGHADGIEYGVAVGVDVPIGSTIFAGFEASADDSSTKFCGFGCVGAGRDLSAVGRVGVNVGSGVKLYALAGYTNASLGGSKGDGVRAGLGVQIAVSQLVYTKLEYRYSNYEQGVTRNDVIAGVGLGF